MQTITHLVSCTLQAAQNSDALWAEPALPAYPSTQKKHRHPTVQEALGGRIKAHWGQEGDDGRSRSSLSEGTAEPSPPAGGRAAGAAAAGGKPPRPSLDGSGKENLSSAANTPAGPLEEGAASLEASGGRSASRSASRSVSRAASPRPLQLQQQDVEWQTPVGLQGAAAAAAAGQLSIGEMGSADITDFERKLADLMRRMQQDQARLQGKAAAAGGGDGHAALGAARPALPPLDGSASGDGLQVRGAGSPAMQGAALHDNDLPQ